jgi:tRNA(Ser,Leu) C12 N-acetylase TAN1
VFNEKAEIDYVKIETLAGRVLEGKAELGRLNRKEEKGRIASGRRNVEASLVLGAYKGDSAVGESSSYESVRAEAGRQKNALKAFAEEKEKRGEKIWFSSHDIESMIVGAIDKTAGAEADVYYMPDGTVIKIVEHSNTPFEFMDDRVSLYNYLFSETSYELIGFTDDLYDENLTTFIVRQKTVNGRTLYEQLKDIPQYKREEAEKRMKEIVVAKMWQDFGATPAKTDNSYKNSDYYIPLLSGKKITDRHTTPPKYSNLPPNVVK